MELKQALAIANAAILTSVGRSLTEVEAAILSGAWNDQTYEQIAQVSGYSLNYIQRDVAPKFWKLLSEVYQRKLNKTNARAIMTQMGDRFTFEDHAIFSTENIESDGAENKPQEQKDQREATGKEGSETANKEQTSANVLGLVPAPQSPPAISTLADWGEAPDVSIFYGRTEDIHALTHWVLVDQCRLVALLGMGGIGKSSLAAKLMQEVQGAFEFVIWRSLRNAPPLKTLLNDLILFLSRQQDTQATPERLLHWLRTHRCLVVLDNVETIMQAGDRVGVYQPGYESYGSLFRLLGETTYQSCIVLTSREKPVEVSLLESLAGKVRSLNLAGDWNTALALLTSKNLVGSEDNQRRLCEFYSCSPLALKIVAASIQTLFDGDIATFLAEETMVFNGVRRLLDQQFERLTELEQRIMVWLALNREWTSLSELHNDLFPQVTRARLLESLESLAWRSLIEQNKGHYTQQPVVMEYVTDQVIQQAIASFLEANLDFLSHYALLKTTVKDYISESVRSLVLKPIANQIRLGLGTGSALKAQVERLLQVIREEWGQNSGYAAGNVINLCRFLEVDLTGFDFSHLPVWHADLQQMALRQVSFQSTDLTHSTFTQSFGNPLSVSLSSDGYSLATGDINGDIQVWDVITGQPKQTLQGHQSWILTLAWATDGRWLASGSDDQTIRIWNIETGHCHHQLVGHSNSVRSLAWSPDQRFLVSSSDDHTLRLWEAETGECVTTFTGHQNSVRSVAWHPHRALIASASVDGTLALWHPFTGERLHRLDAEGRKARMVVWHPAGIYLAISNDDGSVCLWDMDTASIAYIFQGHTSLAFGLAWSPDGEALASSSDDRTIRIWDLKQRQCVRVLQGHHDSIWSISWRSHSHQNDQLDSILVSGSHDQTVKLWNPLTGQCLKTLYGHTSSLRDLDWNHDGTCLASVTHSRHLKLWDMTTYRSLNSSLAQGVTAWTVAWNPSAACGHCLAVSNNCIQIWDTRTNQCLKTLQGHQNWIWWMAWNPSRANAIEACGAHIASVADDQTVRLWDVSTGQCLQVLQGHQGWVRAVDWSPDGRQIASGSDDQTIRLWDVETGTCQRLLKGHCGPIRTLAWHPHQPLLVSGSYDQTLRLWNTETGECLRCIEGFPSAVWSVKWNASGTKVACAGANHSVWLWSWQTEQAPQLLTGHEDVVFAIAWNPNPAEVSSQVLASCSNDRSIRLWDTESGRCLQVLRDGPYEGMNIANAKGITTAQIANLQVLGALTADFSPQA